MMEQFRKFGATKASKAMLYLLVICFGAWGIGGYLTSSIGAEALTVNGEGVSPKAVEDTYNQRLQNVTQLIGSKPTPEQIDQMQLPEQVLAEVVARTVLRQTAENMQFQPATKQLQAEIAMVSAFKNEKGQFDAARYRQILQQINRTPAQFEHDLGQDIIVRQLAQLSKVELPTQNLAALVASSEDAHLTLDVATFSPADIGTAPVPTQAELEKFYAENAAVYSKPETRDLVVLRLSREEIAKSITVPEKDVQKAYEDNKVAYALPEQRVVRHILVDSEEEAKKLVPAITSLQTFEAAANTNSKDPGNAGTKGGLLGSIQQKDVVPAFGKVAFSLAPNTLSQPVKSNFGWHLIWVDKIDLAKSLTFEEVKDPIARDLQATQAAEALERLVAQVDEKVAAREPLSKIATDLGLKTAQHNMVTNADEGVEPNELQTAFTLNKGDISVPITTKDGGSTYVQVTEITPAKTQPLAEVKARVTTDWQNARIQTVLQQNAEKLVGVARAPEFKGNLTAALAAVQANSPISAQVAPLTLPTASEAPTWMQRHLLSIYPMAIGGVLPAAIRDGDKWHVIRLAERTETPPDAESLPSTSKIYQQRLQGDVEALLMNYLTQQARVKLNQAQLKSMFGREISWDAPATN